MKSYCYVGRFNNDRVYVNENTDTLFKSMREWVKLKPWPRIPNQVDDTYYVMDIGCSTDVPLMRKHYDWQKVFTFFNEEEKLKSTFATKYPARFNLNDYDLNPSKHRIRVSLMPQIFSDVLEPNTEKIKSRIEQIPRLMQGMEVHVNFSPIIYEDGWLKHYNELFSMLKINGIDVKCECIFLTYNEKQYERNSDPVNKLCWKPELQEHKDSHYADNNIRYKWKFKNNLIDEFENLYEKFFNLNNIRYIF